MATRHDLVIARLVHDYAAETRAFRSTIERTLDAPKEFRWLKLIPDAYRIGNRCVTAYEVEDTHRVDADKLRAYARLWSQLDGMEWDFRLVIMDIRGGVFEPNLADVYFE